MSSKSNANEATESNSTPSQAPEADGATLENDAHVEKIRLRAYQFYVERGGQPGLDLDDWLQAERELGQVGSRSLGAVRAGKQQHRAATRIDSDKR
jgi:hypothetical protein